MTQEHNPMTMARPAAAGATAGGLRCLIVDDEADIRSTLGLCLETLGHCVQEVATADDAIGAACAHPFDMAFVDVRLGTVSGLDLMTRLLALSPRLNILIITAYASVSVAVQAMSRGATDFLCKPFTPDQVAGAVGRVAELRALEQNVGAIHDRAGTAGPEADFASASADVQEAVMTARQAAPSQIPILITGESGTGKRVLARAIHGWSSRQDGPYRSVHCGQSSRAYVDLALFGETNLGEKPVLSDHPSLLDECNGGTLVIGQIEALSPRSQIKLTRILEKREYEVPGTFTTRECDVRIIGTGSESILSPDSPIAADLRAALQNVNITLPPLRQRTDDIHMLVQRYVGFIRQTAGKSVLGFGAEALEILQGYAWPGNLHELRDVVTQAVAQCDGSYVEARHLPAMVRKASTMRGKRMRVGDPVSLRTLEEQHIRAVLESAGSLQEAGEILGMDYQTLYRRRKQFGI